MSFYINLDDARLSTPIANLKRYLQDIERYPVLPNDEIVKLIERSRDQERSPDDRLEARHRIMLANQRLVVLAAIEFAKRGLGEVTDLIQEGNFGLDKAIGGFKPELGFYFSTYARCRIRGAIMRATYAVAEHRTIYIPPNRVDMIHRLKNMRTLWLGQQGRLPEIDEVAEHFGIGKRGAASLMFDADQDVKNWKKTSIDSEEAFDEEEAVIDEGRISTEDKTEEYLLKSKLQEILLKLPPNDRLILEHHFGLNDKPVLSFVEIYDKLGYRYRKDIMAKFDRIRKEYKRLISRLRNHHQEELRDLFWIWD